MPRSIQRFIPRLIDVAAHHPIQIAPTDDKSHDDPALVHPLGIVGRPDDGISNAGVDAQRAEECACVLYPGGSARAEHGEAGHADQGAADVAEAALAGAVGEGADGDGQHGGGGIGWHGEELCFCGGVAELCHACNLI